MMYIDVPAKVFSCRVTEVAGAAMWPYDNGKDEYWSGGSSPKFYRWSLTVSIEPQLHSSPSTRQPLVFNGNDVTVGSYIADTQNGICVKIISIASKSETAITCIVEDILRYNTYRDPGQNAIGIFSAPCDAVIFDVNEEGEPIIDPAPSTTNPNFFTNISSRFANFEQNFNFILEKTNHGFALGDLIAADSLNNTFVLAGPTNPYLVGTVTNVDLGPDRFMVSPLQKVVDGYNKLIGDIGSVIYSDDSNPGGFSLTGTHPVMIKLREETNTVVTGASLAGNAATDVGAQFTLNGFTVTVGNTGSPADFCDAVNGETGNTLVSAELVEQSPTATTDPALLNTFGLVVTAVPSQVEINGVMVTFTTTTSGAVSLGDGYADQFDMAEDINAASIPGVTATASGAGLTLTNTLGTITLVNQAADGLGNLFAGPSSASGLPTSITEGSTYIVMTADGAGPINLHDTVGETLNVFGLYSAENGVKAAALYIEQGIRAAKTYVVADIAARDSLEPLPGDQAYVADQGNGEWAFFIYTLSDTWVQMADKDSSETDAQSVEVVVTNASATSGAIHTISEGRRVSFVTVTVTEAFDGDPSLTVGDDDNNARLMTDEQNDLGSVGDYSTTPSHTYSGAGDTTIKFYFDAAGATVGSAIIAITYT